MNVSYKRSVDRNYLVLEQEEFEEEYQTGMIVRNKIPGFLGCRLNRIDEKAMFYYEITSKQSLSLVLERKSLSSGELRKMLESLQNAAGSCGEYLLDENKILLRPDYIYLDPDEWQFSFCYFPCEEQDLQEGLLSLAEYLLEHLNRQDQGAVALAYEFYRMAGQVNASLSLCLSGWEEEEVRDEEEFTGSGAGAANGEDEEYKTVKPKDREDAVERPGTVLLAEAADSALVLRSLNPAYQNIRVTGESFLIGKKKDAVDGWLKARGISRIHGKISREGRDYFLTDLNSTNGTFLNGGRLGVNEKARIRSGDCVGFAEVEYMVEYRNVL